MKKNKVKHKRKLKKNWIKKFGYFSFENPVYSKGGNIEVSCFFKGELIGILDTTQGRVFSHSKQTTVYKLLLYDQYSSFGLHKRIGIVMCSGCVHGLPKSILDVNIEIHDTLIKKRTVLTEKDNFRIILVGDGTSFLTMT